MSIRKITGSEGTDMKTITPPRSGDIYLDLVKRFPLRPLRSEAEHDRAIKMMLQVEAEHPHPSRAVLDYLDILADIIDNYENHAGLKMDVADVTPSQIIAHLANENGLTITQLAAELRINQGNFSEMLSGNRQFSKTAITALCHRFRLSADLFLSRAVL